MTTTAPFEQRVTGPGPSAERGTSWAGVAGLASLGAGAVHAAAAGAHGEHRSAVLLFTALAVAQLAWGALALVRRDRAVAGIGLALGIGSVLGWVLAKTVGLPLVGGLDVAEPVPYDPALPIDLGGTPGVTPEQQAAAENLVAVTLSRLPQWADATVAEAAGFRTIGDGFTGTEHLINEEFQNDDVVLDPDRPESLVYDTTGGGRRLVAAMYMVAAGTPLDQVPDIGGDLVQWHTHENLCYSPEGYVSALTDASGNCPPGLIKPVPAPMVHVWITPHRCGPFAALEGIAGGRIPDGETRLCDHAHGSAS